MHKINHLTLKELFPDLTEQNLLDEIIESSELQHIPADTDIIEYGQYIRFMPLVISGIIKVMRNSSEGHELFLYYVQPGETCAISLACCLGMKKSAVSARTEEDCDVLMLPIEKMDEWMQRHSSWRNFVINSYSNRFNEMIEVIDSIAFKKMDERLRMYLAEKFRAQGTNELTTTHQIIADEMGSTREVISRLLKQMENDNLITLQRNQINKISDL